MEIRIPITRTLDDYREGYRAQRPAVKWFILEGLLLSLAGVLFIYWGSPYFGGAEIAGVLFLMWYSVSYRVQVLARVAQRAHANHSNIEYILQDDGVAASTSVGQSLTKWAAFKRFVETPNEFLLVYPNKIFVIIPKRCIAADQLDAARGLLAANVAAAPGRG